MRSDSCSQAGALVSGVWGDGEELLQAEVFNLEGRPEGASPRLRR